MYITYVGGHCVHKDGVEPVEGDQRKINTVKENHRHYSTHHIHSSGGLTQLHEHALRVELYITRGMILTCLLCLA